MKETISQIASGKRIIKKDGKKMTGRKGKLV